MAYNKPYEKKEAPKNAPSARFKVGAVEVSQWENKAEKGTFFSYTIQRSYKKGDTWGQTSSLKDNDLPKAILALQEAYKARYIKTHTGEIEVEDVD